jgi:hypothetical protein
LAKVINPLNSAEARGKVNGLVYNTWRGIHYVKTNTPPSHEGDEKRQIRKNIVQAAAVRWQTISEEDRSAWRYYATTHFDISWTGAPKRISGFNWYVRIQVALQDISIGYVDSPPSVANASYLEDPIAEYDTGFIYVRAAAFHPDDAENYWLDIWSTKPLSAGRNPSLHDAYRRVIVNANETDFRFHEIGAGTYTVFVRTISIHGLCNPFVSMRVSVP